MTALGMIRAQPLGSELRLFIGKSFTDVTVRRDTKWPSMWRVNTADGWVSDMVNLTRAKDAAIQCARPKGLGGTEIVRWDRRETAVRGATAHFEAGAS
jgi:hypothetical protein